MADLIFAEGINAYKPSDRAPEFVKANISIDAKKFQEWLQTHPELRDEKGLVRLVLKASAKEGNPYYLSVDTYKPADKPSASEDVPEDINPDDIPF